MANKYHSDSSTVIETITYAPGRQDTGDLVPATKTITATEEASGIANKDYSSAKTLTAPTDARLAIISLITRLSVTIDSDDGTHDLRCRVYVDAQDADHLLFDLTYVSTGNQLAVQALTASTKPIIFDLLKNGSPHTFYFFFWSPGNHSPVISLVNLWEAVGSNKTSGWGNKVLTFTPASHCEVQLRFFHYLIGTGVQSWTMMLNDDSNGNQGKFAMHETGALELTALSQGFNGTYQMLPAGYNIQLLVYGNVATDLQYLSAITYFIKRWN